MVHLKRLGLSKGAGSIAWQVTDGWVGGVRCSKGTSLSCLRHIISLHGPSKDIGVIHRSLQHSLAGDLQLDRWSEVETSVSWPQHIILLHCPFKNIGVIHRSLQHSLAGDLKLGRWGEDQQGEVIVLASAYNLFTWSI